MDWEMEMTERKRTGACLLLPEESGWRAQRSVIRKNGKGAPLAGKRESPLSVFPLLRFFRAGGAMAGRLFFGRADKIGEGFVPAG